MNTAIVRGNRMFRQCSASPLQEATHPDATINLTCIELRNMTLYVLADRLSPVARKWWNEPWLAQDIVAWEKVLVEALEVDGLPERFKIGLRHVLGIVSRWLAEFDQYEQACVGDERETMLEALK